MLGVFGYLHRRSLFAHLIVMLDTCVHTYAPHLCIVGDPRDQSQTYVCTQAVSITSISPSYKDTPHADRIFSQLGICLLNPHDGNGCDLKA